MALINHGLAALACAGVLMACAPKKVGADTHVWNVTAQNGDKMTGCLAEDVKPDVLGYIDIEALPDFNITTFEAFESGYEEYKATGKSQTHLVGSPFATHPFGLRETREDGIKHCDAYPSPRGATE